MAFPAAAQATNEADRLSILEDIGKTIGVDRLNNLIREALVDSTVRACACVCVRECMCACACVCLCVCE